jgi:hypothetical protein
MAASKRDFDLVAASFSEIFDACINDPDLIVDILHVSAQAVAEVSADAFTAAQQTVDHINAGRQDSPDIDGFMGHLYRLNQLASQVQKAMHAANEAAARLDQ